MFYDYFRGYESKFILLNSRYLSEEKFVYYRLEK